MNAIRLSGEFAAEFGALDKLLAGIASDKALLPCAQDSLLGAGEVAFVQAGSLRIASRQE